VCEVSARMDAVAFARDGYVILDIFTQAELSRFKHSYHGLVISYLRKAGLSGACGIRIDDGLRALEAADHRYVAELYDASAQLPAFLALVSNQRVEDTINRLLSRAPGSSLYAFHNRCRIDPTGDSRRTYNWHQEVFYTIPKSKLVQTWAPLIRDTNCQNGTIEACIGSHAEGTAKSTWTESPGKATQIIVDPTVVSKYTQIKLPMTLGQVMFFDGRLFHRSGQNTSKDIRFSLVGMYHDVDSGFRAPEVKMEYRGMTPREWYDANS
jgi:ectoine hydroxylase-related dioxygenase (phytanoyl-CoA dioxygenase family)